MTDSSGADGLSALNAADNRTAETLILSFVGIPSGALTLRVLFPPEDGAGIGFWKGEKIEDEVSSSSESLSGLSLGTREVRERCPVEGTEVGVLGRERLSFEGVADLNWRLGGPVAAILACPSWWGVWLMVFCDSPSDR